LAYSSRAKRCVLDNRDADALSFNTIQIYCDEAGASKLIDVLSIGAVFGDSLLW